MPLRRVVVALAAFFLLAGPAAAKPRRLFYAVSVKGHQTVDWQQVVRPPDPCSPTATRSGTQTIYFESPKPKRLEIDVYRRLLGKRNVAVGGGQVSADWVFDRQFTESATQPSCPEPAAVAAQSQYDCGRRGPYRYFVAFAYRDSKALSLDAAPRVFGPGTTGPVYRTCDYEGFHEHSIAEVTERLRLKKLLRRRSVRVHFASRREETDRQDDVSLTTTLSADVTLRRVR